MSSIVASHKSSLFRACDTPCVAMSNCLTMRALVQSKQHRLSLLTRFIKLSWCCALSSFETSVASLLSPLSTSRSRGPMVQRPR